MKFEYLLFNLVVIAGPIACQFNRQIKPISYWRLRLLTSAIVMIPYIIWDVLVTDSHWWFNPAHTLNFRLLGLPIEEWFFFITVPFGCLLVWETLRQANKETQMKSLRYVRLILYMMLLGGVSVFSMGKQYTGLVLLCFGLVGLTDRLLRVDMLLQPKTYLYLVVVFGLVLVFNGYLTARPVVLYGEAYQIGYRIFSIPIEDFGYGFTLMLFNAILYEKLRKTCYGT